MVKTLFRFCHRSIRPHQKMVSYTAAANATLVALQTLLATFQSNLSPTAYLSLPNADVDTVISTAYFDFIVVGGGSAGLALASRLAESFENILVLEQGGIPPIESIWPGLFTALPNSVYDRGMNIYNDSYSCQNLKSNIVTAGKMLGGSSSLEHMVHPSPLTSDYDSWGTAANDTSWSFPDFAKYFAKGEKVQDKGVLEENATLHGTCGPQILSKQESSSMKSIISACVEMGFKLASDAIGPGQMNFPLLGIGNACNKMRQSSFTSFLSKIDDKKRVTLLTDATVTKIIFDGTTATGVQFNVGGSSYSINATKNIIISAGAMKTPQILMLSGIGDSAVLKKLQIPVVVDNPNVGQNLMDHPGTMLAIGMENSTETAPAVDLAKYPVDLLTNYAGSSLNKTDILNLMIRFPPNSSGFLQLCGSGFKYSDAICDSIYKVNIKKNVMVVIAYLSKNSVGHVTINSTDINEDPIIVLNLLSNKTDLNLFAESIMAFANICNTTVFKNFEAELVDVGVCSEHIKYSLEFWQCYVLKISTTGYSYSGTCAMGSVVDSKLRVIGTSNLRVVDASVMPDLPVGTILPSVMAIAEKAADIIKEEFKQTL